MTDNLFNDVYTLTQSCRKCGSEFSFPKPKRGRYPQFCSDRCRYDAERDVQAIRREQYVKSPFVCQQCGNLSQRYGAAKFCGDDCAAKWSAERRKLRPNVSGQHRLITKQCKACDRSFQVRSDNDKFLCSETCQKDWRRIRKRVWFTIFKRPKVFRIPPLPRTCRTCRKVAVGYRKHFCSDCADQAFNIRTRIYRVKYIQRLKETGVWSAQRMLRKKRIRAVADEVVNPVVVLERDCWTCQICGEPTPRNLRGSYDMRAPEVDHIIPISRGGRHSYSNVQCACRSCNLDKSNKIIFGGIVF